MSKTFRVIAKIDVKSSFVIKGVNFEGMRKIGKAKFFAKKYFKAGVDELIINDVNASLFGRSTSLNLLKSCCKDIFIPVTLAGGLKNIDDVAKALQSGADKVAINSAAVKNKSIIKNIAQMFGSQALIISINAKKISFNKWEVFIDKGREETGLDVFKWAKFAEKSGAGEIHINSIDNDGTFNGFDYSLVKKLSKVIKLPLVVGGGLGSLEHIDRLLRIENIEGVSISSALHYNKLKINHIKQQIKKNNINVRI
jgi:cyclase